MVNFTREKEYYSEKAKCYEELCRSSTADFSSVISKTESSAKRRELSRGGGTIHRGYYCPSPIKDKVIGGCKRGRLISKLPSKSDAVYEYYFNESNEMTLVNKYTLEQGQMYYTQCEIIDKKDGGTQSTILADMMHMPHISGMSECNYDSGLITLYEYAALVGQGDNVFCASIESERYIYDGQRLVTCFMNIYTSAIGLLQSQRYDLIYNGDAPIQYTVRKYFDGGHRASDEPERVYELLKR